MRGNDIEAKACIEQAQFFPAGQVQRLCRLVNQMTDDGTGSAAFLIRWPHHNRRQFVRPSRCVFTCPQPINLQLITTPHIWDNVSIIGDKTQIWGVLF